VADAVISRLKTIKVEGMARTRAAINDLVTLVDETDRARHEADEPVQEWLETLIATVRERLKASKAEVDRMAKTVAGMAVVESTDDEATARNVSHELQAKRQRLGELQVEIGKLTATLSEAERTARRRQELQAKIDSTPDQSGKLAELEEKRAEVEKVAVGKRKVSECMAKLATAMSAESLARAARTMPPRRLRPRWTNWRRRRSCLSARSAVRKARLAE
jgi:chromosome segregation ATPase